MHMGVCKIHSAEIVNITIRVGYLDSVHYEFLYISIFVYLSDSIRQ